MVGSCIEEAMGKYKWSGYFTLVHMILKAGLGSTFPSASMPPNTKTLWVPEIGESEPDIFFADRPEKHYKDCMPFGVDDLSIFYGKRAMNIYQGFFESIKTTFALSMGSTIMGITIGVGLDGELRYPCNQSQNKNGVTSRTGEFQCYDQNMMTDLKKHVEDLGTIIGDFHDAQVITNNNLEHLQRRRIVGDSLHRFLSFMVFNETCISCRPNHICLNFWRYSNHGVEKASFDGDEIKMAEETKSGIISSFLGGLNSHMRQFMFRVISCGPIPQHIAFIMDGNRRFAKKWKLEEGAGHKAGFLALMSVLKYCYEIGVKYVTVYAFSLDNFNRRPDEVQYVMDLMQEKIEGFLKELDMVSRYGVRVLFIGDLNRLDAPVNLRSFLFYHYQLL